jgi:hypothetical protein
MRTWDDAQCRATDREDQKLERITSRERRMRAKKAKWKVEGVPYAYQLQIVVEDIQVPGGFTGYVRNIADQMRIQGCRGQLQRALSLQFTDTARFRAPNSPRFNMHTVLEITYIFSPRALLLRTGPQAQVHAHTMNAFVIFHTPRATAGESEVIIQYPYDTCASACPDVSLSFDDAFVTCCIKSCSFADDLPQ